jgi:sodium/proline symporter
MGSLSSGIPVKYTVPTMNTATLATFALYLLAMLSLGIIAWRATESLPDYILGGRRLGAAVTALSAGASDMSGWLLLGLPGAFYASGLNQIWIVFGLILGALANWHFVAARLRHYSEKANDSLTIPDFLENRFQDKSRMLRLISALAILLFFTFYVSSGMVSGALLFEKSFGLPYTTALLVGSFVIVSYTFLGGYLAVCWTDFFQGLLMLLALVITPLVVIGELGGWSATIETIERVKPTALDSFHETGFLAIVSLMAWGLGYFGQPHILARFMGISSTEEVRKAKYIGMSWMIVSMMGAMLIGLTGIAWYDSNPIENSETIMILLTQVLFNPWIAGVLLAAILAAIMSTIDSQLLVSSSAVAEDLYRGFIRRDASQKELVWVSRLAVAGVAVVAGVLAMNPDSSVLDLVGYAWAGFGATFGPLILLSLTWSKTTRNGALAGMLVGAATVVIWGSLKGGIFDLYELAPGFVFSALAIVIVSRLAQEPGVGSEEV